MLAVLCFSAQATEINWQEVLSGDFSAGVGQDSYTTTSTQATVIAYYHTAYAELTADTPFILKSFSTPQFAGSAYCGNGFTCPQADRSKVAPIVYTTGTYTVAWSGDFTTRTYLGISGLGAAGTPDTLTFDQPFTLLATSSVTGLSANGLTLTGEAGYGVIQFDGPSTYTFSFSGGTPLILGFGDEDLPPDVPEPSTVALIGSGLTAAVVARRKRT
jgi:hypothetical protein